MVNLSFDLDRDRIGVLSAAILLGLALARFLETPIRPLRANVLGSPVGLELSATTLLLLIMAGMGITAAESVVRSHPLARKGELGQSFMFWIVPGLLVVGLASWLGKIESLGLWTGALLISAIVVPLSLAAEYALVDVGRRGNATLQWAYTALIHLIAILLFARIYDLRARTLLSGTAVFLVATLLAARLFWLTLQASREAFLYGAVAGALVGQLTWAINYWPIGTFQGSLILLLAYYVVAGLLLQYLNGRFGRRIVLEYLGVSLLGLLVIAVWAG